MKYPPSFISAVGCCRREVTISSCFLPSATHSKLEGSVGLLLAGMLAKLVSENSGKGIFWGFSEVVVGFVCFVLIAIPLEERKKTAVPGKYWGVEASLSCLPPSADFGAFDIS